MRKRDRFGFLVFVHSIQNATGGDEGNLEELKACLYYIIERSSHVDYLCTVMYNSYTYRPCRGFK